MGAIQTNMLPEKFIKLTSRVWNSYLQQVQGLANKGQLSCRYGRILLYPNIMLYAVTKEHFIVELIGANKTFQKLVPKKHAETSIDRYLNQFSDIPGNGLLHIDCNETHIKDICLSHASDLQSLEDRFPMVKQFGTRIVKADGSGSVLPVGPNCEVLTLDNCNIVNRESLAFRAKYVLHILIVKRTLTERRHSEIMQKIFNSDNRVKGIHSCLAGTEEDYIVAGQLQNLYLSPKLRETTIGEFLKTHPQIVKRGFAAKNFVYEPTLPWIEGSPENNDREINPDLLVQRGDGFYDIYDLKTAALDKKKITKGERCRRRFIEYIQEGAAQLANYRDYFSYRKNRDYAKEKFNVQVNNPNLVLVVGNYDNVEKVEVQEACRQYANITIIDYDTLIQIFLSNISSPQTL